MRKVIAKAAQEQSQAMLLGHIYLRRHDRGRSLSSLIPRRSAMTAVSDCKGRDGGRPARRAIAPSSTRGAQAAGDEVGGVRRGRCRRSPAGLPHQPRASGAGTQGDLRCPRLGARQFRARLPRRSGRHRCRPRRKRPGISVAAVRPKLQMDAATDRGRPARWPRLRYA